MPRLLRTVFPRIKKSLAERGVLASLFRSVLLPIHLVQEYREAKLGQRNSSRSEFDMIHGVETDGDFGATTYLSDLSISSQDWIYGRNYSGIVPDRFFAALASLHLQFDSFVFIDFGSGKGRALLLASEFPFKRIIGIEFAPELHAIAQRNIQKYLSRPRRCASIESVCMDFTEFELPNDPCVLYFLDPTAGRIFAKVLENIRRSWQKHPRPIYIVYVTPVSEQLFDSADFLSKLARNDEQWFCIYRTR
jgi:SAM-dependent methyltransferase